MKRIICFSGGQSSALAAIEVARRYGVQDMVLLNHDIHAAVEHPDIKRFKLDISKALGVPLTFANIQEKEFVDVDQFDVCLDANAFHTKGLALCTSRLKTQPFMNWIKKNADPADTVIYYGFDPKETHRVQRRSGIMGAMGWKTDYPLLWNPRTIQSAREIGVKPPLTYCQFSRANCIGCLKAGWQHWYIVYCERPDVWEKAKWAEDEIGYAIHMDPKKGPVFLDEMEDRFARMRAAGVPATEKIPAATFWAKVRKVEKDIPVVFDAMPCDCTD